MRILKIKIPTKTLLTLKIPDYFSIIRHIEILQIYQYDRNNFFALHKILFKPNQIQNLVQYLYEFFLAQSFQILETRGDEVLCIIKQRSTSGFWPSLLSESWALLPPIIIDPEAMIVSIITKEDYQLSAILKQFQVFTSIELLAVSKPDETIENFAHSLPGLTTRQREIMTYASRHGYFALPKKISTQQLASHFGISTSAVINHIQKAEKILVKFHFG